MRKIHFVYGFAGKKTYCKKDLNLNNAFPKAFLYTHDQKLVTCKNCAREIAKQVLKQIRDLEKGA